MGEDLASRARVRKDEWLSRFDRDSGWARAGFRLHSYLDVFAKPVQEPKKPIDREAVGLTVKQAGHIRLFEAEQLCRVGLSKPLSSDGVAYLPDQPCLEQLFL